jgi:hypothetical protein
VVSIPDWLHVAIFGLFTLVTLLVLTLLFPRGLRRRKEDEEEFELVYEGPKPSVWVLVLLLGLTLLPLGVAGYLLWLKWTQFEQGILSGPLSSVPRPRPLPPLPEAVGPLVESPVFTGGVAALGVVGGVGALGVLLWIYLGDRIIGGWVGPSAQPREVLSEAVEESLESLRQDADARRAIIRCYRRFEQVLAGTGLPRAPWETPTEFMRKALPRQPIPGKAVGVLTELFEVCRFSHHPVGPAERDTAISSLIEIKAALEREVSDAHAA